MNPISKSYWAWNNDSLVLVKGQGVKIEGLEGLDLFVYLHPFVTGVGGFWRVCEGVSGMEIVPLKPTFYRPSHRQEAIDNIADYTMANPNFRAVVADKVSARVRIGTISPRYESSTKVMLQY